MWPSRSTRAWEAREELLQGHLPLASLSAQEAVVGQFLVASWVLASWGASAWLSFRVQLQAITLLHCSMMAPQQQGASHVAVNNASQIAVTRLLFLRCPVGQGTLAVTFFLLLISV